MPTTSRLFLHGALLLSTAGLGLALSAPAHAQQPPSAAAQRNAQMAEQRKRMSEATGMVTQLKAEQKRIKDKLINDFSGKEEWKNTVPNQKKAKADYQKAQELALRSLQSKPEYRQLQKDREAIRVKLDAASKPGGDPDEIAKLGTDLATKGIALKKMEAEAAETDEKAVAAKEKLDAAQKEMDALDQEVETALQSDPEYAAISLQVEQAELNVAQMKEQAEQQRKSEAAARASQRPVKAPKGPPRGARGGGYGAEGP